MTVFDHVEIYHFLTRITAHPHVHMDTGWSQRPCRLLLWNMFEHATKTVGSTDLTQNTVELPKFWTKMITLLHLNRQVFLGIHFTNKISEFTIFMF